MSTRRIAPKTITVHQTDSELIIYTKSDGYSASFDTALLGVFPTPTLARQAINEHRLALIEMGLIVTGVLETVNNCYYTA